MTYDYSKYEWQIGTEVIGKSKDIDVTCVGAIHNIFEHDGNRCYLCNYNSPLRIFELQSAL